MIIQDPSGYRGEFVIYTDIFRIFIVGRFHLALQNNGE